MFDSSYFNETKTINKIRHLKLKNKQYKVITLYKLYFIKKCMIFASNLPLVYLYTSLV